MTELQTRLARLAAEGGRLRGSRGEVGAAAGFEVDRDLGGRVNAVVWRPSPPIGFLWSELESIGDVRISPRMPDAGTDGAIIYIPGGRLLLDYVSEGEAGGRLVEARSTGR